MVKELKELIEDISSIDTSVDMDDIKMVSGLNTSIICDILSVRDFLIELNLPKTEKKDLPEAVKDPEDIAEYHVKEADPYAELKKLGLTQKTIEVCQELYNARAKIAKMSFDTMMKCAVFVHNYVVVHGGFFNGTYTIGRLIVNRELEKYLKEIDPGTRYIPANIYDYLSQKNFKNITSKFFDCSGSVLQTTGVCIDKENPV